MTPQRISIKWYARERDVPFASFTKLFHRWIQNKAVEGLLIDVADYKHVPNGPGVMLIGHDVDYSIDCTGGKPGLLVTRKQYDRNQPLAEVLRDTFGKLIHAAHTIEADETVALSFHRDRGTVSLIDRLVSPNTAEAYAEFEPIVAEICTAVLGQRAKLQRGSTDERTSLQLEVRVESEPSWQSLREHLRANAMAK